MLRNALIASLSMAFPGLPVQAADLPTETTSLCVRNLAQHDHFFAVEAAGTARLTATLAPGEVLCTEGTAGTTGVVSVFEGDEGFEGCSRLVRVGRTEDMLKYVDFDRCFWSSNS